MNTDYEKLEDELKSALSNLQHEADLRVDLAVKFIKLKGVETKLEKAKELLSHVVNPFSNMSDQERHTAILEFLEEGLFK